MLKVLILAYDFPPYVSVGGLRPLSWLKYLHYYEIWPTVVTRQWGNQFGNHLDYVAAGDSPCVQIENLAGGSVVRTPYTPNLANRLMLKYGVSKFNLLRRGISAFYEFGQFVLPIGPKINIYRGADEYLKNNQVDLIIATGEPFILFKYAAKLSSKYNIPWIADYRDPWSQDKNRIRGRLNQAWAKHFEKKFLSNASAVTTVSEFFQQQISGFISDKPSFVVCNGYDPEAVARVSNISQRDDKFSLALVGTIYDWHPIESFLRVCSNFVGSLEDASKFAVNFYGISAESRLRQLIENKFRILEPLIQIHSKIPNEQFLGELVKNNVFVLFNHYTTVGTKIYDFVALKRQVLLLYDEDKEALALKHLYYNIEEGDDDRVQLQKQILLETKSGIVVRDAVHLSEILDDLYAEFKMKGFVACNSINTEQYSRKIQAQNLAEVIKEVLSSQSNKQ